MESIERELEPLEIKDAPEHDPYRLIPVRSVMAHDPARS
jgi:hypothetical protein